MLWELIPMTESILFDSGRKFGKRQNGGRTDGKDRTRDEGEAEGRWRYVMSVNTGAIKVTKNQTFIYKKSYIHFLQNFVL